LWDFGTVRNVARQTISRANGPSMATFVEEEFDLEPSSSGSSSAYITARSVSGQGPAGPRELNQARHSVHSPPIHYAEQELQHQQHALAQARLQQQGGASPKQAYRANGTGSVRRRDATVSSMSSGSSTLGRISVSDIVIKGDVPHSPQRGGHDRLVSQDSGTVRGGVGGGGAAGRSTGAPGRWQDDPEEEEQEVLAEQQQHARQAAEAGGPREDVEVGEELDDRTMLDSVILPIIASVRPLLSLT
jgi:hypothetical protein